MKKMKMLRKTLLVASLATLTTFTSCVDNEVAPELKNLREAQAAYIQAQANLENAEAQKVIIQNAYDDALNAIKLQREEAELTRDLMQIDVELNEFKADLADAEKALAQAVADLERYIAERGLEDAGHYLTEYSAAAAILNGKVGDQFVMQAEVAKQELILASLDAPWEIQKERLERDLAKETAKLAAQEAALTALEAVAEDPATAMDEAQALSVQILELKNNNAALEIELHKAHNVIAA